MVLLPNDPFKGGQLVLRHISLLQPRQAKEGTIPPTAEGFFTLFVIHSTKA